MTHHEACKELDRGNFLATARYLLNREEQRLIENDLAIASRSQASIVQGEIQYVRKMIGSLTTHLTEADDVLGLADLYSIERDFELLIGKLTGQVKPCVECEQRRRKEDDELTAKDRYYTTVFEAEYGPVQTNGVKSDELLKIGF